MVGSIYAFSEWCRSKLQSAQALVNLFFQIFFIDEGERLLWHAGLLQSDAEPASHFCGALGKIKNSFLIRWPPIMVYCTSLGICSNCIFQIWSSLGRQNPIKVFNTVSRGELDTIFSIWVCVCAHKRIGHRKKWDFKLSFLRDRLQCVPYFW